MILVFPNAFFNFKYLDTEIYGSKNGNVIRYEGCSNYVRCYEKKNKFILQNVDRKNLSVDDKFPTSLPF